MAVAIRENLAARRQELEALEPGALDLAAEFLAALHEGCHGRAAELRGTRSPEYRRRQLLGRDGLPVEGLTYLAHTAPDAVVEALQVLARHLGYRLQAEEPDAEASMATVAGRLIEQMGKTSSAIVQALADGQVSVEEACRIDGHIHILNLEQAALESEIHELALGNERKR